MTDASATASTAKPLTGLKVIDLTRMIVGPTASMILADFGADVIKVEPPQGDDTRYQQAVHDPERCAFYLALNRNKRGIVLDLTKPEGIDALKRLVTGADVFIHNFRPGVVEKLGIAHDDLKSVRDDLIYCSISGFGETGPYARRPGTDILFQAMSGLMSVTGEPDGRPMRAGAPIIDVTTGVSAALGIVMAVMSRKQTRKGDYISASLFQQAAFMQAPMLAWSAREQADPDRMGNRSPMALVMDMKTSDGWIMLALPSQKFWKLLCEAADTPGLLDDARFVTHPKRLVNQAELIDHLAPIFAAEPSEIWLDRLLARGVPAAPVQSYTEALADPQFTALGNFWTVGSEAAGDTPVAGLPFGLGTAPVDVYRTPPTLGRDTAEVLAQAGLSADEIAALEAAQVTTPAYTPGEAE